MYIEEPVMFHKAYPLDSFLEESRIMEKERELMFSYLPEEYRNMQRKVEETCDQMEYEGSRMYDEHPDSSVIRRLAKKIRDELSCGVQIARVEPDKDTETGKDTELCQAESCRTDRYQEDIVCCFLCNEILLRRYRTWRSRRYIR